VTEHVFEIAPSGRSKCRSCGSAIAKESIRFGEVMPNAFGEGNMTQWHHPNCATFRRPEPLLEALAAGIYDGPDHAQLVKQAETIEPHRRLQRLGSAEQAPSGRAKCRACNELIEKDTWRLPLVFFEDGTYASSGFIHASCTIEYCETDEVIETVRHFAPELEADDLDELIKAISSSKD
jgi:hypothetical protein